MTQLSDDCFAFGGTLLSAAEALEILSTRIDAQTPVERVALDRALGRALARDVTANSASPPHDNAAVDGYALAAADLDPAAPTSLRVAGRATAGHPLQGAVAPGTAARIFTGAVMPEGADCVVMQEDVRVEADRIIVPPGLGEGANRRRAGEDFAAGEVILRQGDRLRAQDLALAAAAGHADLAVHGPVRVALFSTGDEIREPGEALAPGTIYDANRHLLAGLLAGLGCRVSDLGILPDREPAVRDALARAARDHDLLLTSGGVSTGEEDHVRTAVEALGSLHFWRLSIKPGRPLALGQVGGAAFMGLPGNPVAVMVCFVRFTRPIVLKLGGVRALEPRLYRVAAAFGHAKREGRREWLRARLAPDADGNLVAEKFGRQGSGIISSLVWSEGLVELPEELTRLEPGQMVEFLPFHEVMA